MSPADPSSPTPTQLLASRGYEITVDKGRDSFFALQIEDPEHDEAWLLSDTVHALEKMR
jgi:hypothetical protein